jgi:O-antigen/teichoic acid export membrane protein
MRLAATSQAVKAQLLKNSLFSSCTWATTVIVNLLAIPIMIRYLGVEGYGIYALLTGLVGYFGLLDFGLVDGVTKYVAHHLELGDHASVTQSINATLLLQLIAGGTGVLVLGTFNHQLIRLLHVSPALSQVASRGLYVSAFGFLAEMLVNTYNATLKGLQRFDVLAKTTMVFSSVTVVMTVLTLFAGGRLLAVVVVTVSMTVANLAVLGILIHRQLPFYRVSFLATGRHFHSLFGFSAYIFISRIASTLNSYFLQIVIAVILGPAAVTYFVVPMKMTSTLEAGFNSLVGVIFPHISALKAQGNMESLRDLYSKTSQYIVALSTPVFLFVILFSRQILAVWLGAEFSGRAWPVLTFLSCASLLGVWTMVPANTIYGTGDTKIAATFGSIVACLNLLFSIFLTLRFGIFGTGAAVLITAIQGPVFIWYVTGRVVDISPAKYFKQVFALHIIPATLFFVIGLGIISLTSAMVAWRALVVLALGALLSAVYYSFLLKVHFSNLNDLSWSR